MKLAAFLSDVAIRDFPQRWTNFGNEIFSAVSNGGLWSDDPVSDDTGVRIGLECLKIITEDCTDSDFNARISTTRRNDVLIGLNEISPQILPLLFALLSSQYGIVANANNTLQEMQAYLTNNNRSTDQMTSQEQVLYDAQCTTRDKAAGLCAAILTTCEKFCQSLPLEWMLGTFSSNPDSTNPSPDVENKTDFVSAMLHLLREPSHDINILSISCLRHLACRKLDEHQWIKLLQSLPQAVAEAETAQCQLFPNNLTEQQRRVLQFQYHRKLSKMMAMLVGSHIGFISADKEIVKNQGGTKHQILSSYLSLLSNILSHPSGRICHEQINTWIALLRDPTMSKLLSPYLQTLLNAYMSHLVRLPWNDVEDGTHELTSLIQTSWEEKEEYDSWLMDLRSKCSQLFKYIAQINPKLAAATLHTKLEYLLTHHGNGQPRNLTNGEQLQQWSFACVQFEGFHQPLDNLLQGMPSWSLAEKEDCANSDPGRLEIRASVRSSLNQVANMIISWNPTDVWLKFRRTTLVNALKYYWQYDPTTLLTGVDAMLTYLATSDDHMATRPHSNGKKHSDEIVSLRKRTGACLVSISKKVPHHLVPWLAQLSERVKNLLSSNDLLPMNEMHLYEFLSCVATAVEDPLARSNFVSDVLSNAINVLDSIEVKNAVNSVEGLMATLGISAATNDPSSVTNPLVVKQTTELYVKMFSAFNQLLSVGKRCHEAAKKRPGGGLPPTTATPPTLSTQSNFPDEGPISLSDLAINDPFVPLWPRILPTLLCALDAVLQLWHPNYQAVLLRHNIQRYALAISDEEAYLATKQDSTAGGVYGEGGTAGSIVSGWDRRDVNLAPKWSGWLNELRHTCFQLLGLAAGQRVLFAPELAGIFPRFVSVIVDERHLKSMENRHLTQYLKQFLEILLLSCPATLYQSHLSPILGPLFEHLQYRLQCNWAPIIEPNTLRSSSETTKALTTPACENAAALASNTGEEWFLTYYARCGLFVGDLDAVTGEEVVEKARVELSRALSDCLQAALALKGEWGLVLANQAKEEQAVKKNDPSKLKSGPRTRFNDQEGRRVNADGTPRSENDIAIEARKTLRINSMCRFLLLENEKIAGFLVLTVIQCLGYPDVYTCRRCARICHRILETVSWNEQYTDLLGNKMFSIVVKAIVTEPKWMVGLEWDMINVLRDVYCRLVLGQTLLPGGQGPGLQQPRDPTNPALFEQSKSVDKPLQGGGVLCRSSDMPRVILSRLPSISVENIQTLDKGLTEKRAAKDQKDLLRELLLAAAEALKETEGGFSGNDSTFGSLFERAGTAESLLNQKAQRSAIVPDIPEKLVTYSMMQKHKEQENTDEQAAALGDIFKLS
mmetsp:Transcript_23382/g.34894  ORF Transcript_23382/g.34894 Transcript_23382/m.34894 type:complete len:1349 (-) Transcript_23382:172-4218(-)